MLSADRNSNENPDGLVRHVAVKSCQGKMIQHRLVCILVNEIKRNQHQMDKMVD
jgi:hypothetical protein